MPILVGIDGTGEMSNTKYAKSFADSFVTRLCKDKGYAKYFRGPWADGSGLSYAITAGVAYINDERKQRPLEPILLTGYSRGGLGAVVIAKRLKLQGIKVRAMMLFDCVDRHAHFDGEVIPDNVEHVLHVIRHPGARSRKSFGNDGMKYSAPTEYPTPKQYMCTHGGMGGCPWPCPEGKKKSDFIDEGMGEAVLSAPRSAIPGISTINILAYTTLVTYEQDAAMSKKVWADCLPFLRKHHFIASPLNILTKPNGQPYNTNGPNFA